MLLPPPVAEFQFCRDVSPFGAATVVYPEGTPQAAEVTIDGLTTGDTEQVIFGHSDSFDPEADVPTKSIGYDRPEERAAWVRWRARASDLRTNPSMKYTPDVAADAEALALDALAAFDEIDAIYDTEENRGHQQNGQFVVFPLSVPDAQIMLDEGFQLTLVARNKARRRIRELYGIALYSLWCAEYLRALTQARRDYEESASPPGFKAPDGRPPQPPSSGPGGVAPPRPTIDPIPGEPMRPDVPWNSGNLDLPPDETPPGVLEDGVECDPLTLYPEPWMCVDEDGAWRLRRGQPLPPPAAARSGMSPGLVIGGLALAGVVLVGALSR